MDDKLCEVKHKRVDERIGIIDVRLNEHGKSIDSLEKYQAQATEQVRNLCGQVKGLVKVLYGFLSLGVATFLGFFIWYIQNRT